MKTQTVGAVAASASLHPQKLFYRINEVAKITGVKAYVLRYWETEFDELAPEKDGSDQRRYRSKDIRTVQAIRKLLYEDRFTIKGARGRLKQELRNGPSEAPETPALSAPEPDAKSSGSPQSAKWVKLYTRAMGEKISHLRSDVNGLLKMLDA